MRSKTPTIASKPERHGQPLPNFQRVECFLSPTWLNGLMVRGKRANLMANDDIRAIRQILARFVEAWNARDADAVANLYTDPHVITYPPSKRARKLLRLFASALQIQRRDCQSHPMKSSSSAIGRCSVGRLHFPATMAHRISFISRCCGVKRMANGVCIGGLTRPLGGRHDLIRKFFSFADRARRNEDYS